MTPLRVALDATAAVSGRTGTAVYVTQLSRALPRHGVTPRLFAVGRARVSVPSGCRRFPVPTRLVHRSWAKGGPPRPERLVGPVDVVHAPGLLAPPTRRPVVITVHDLAALDHPELHAPRLVAQVKALAGSLHRAAVVIAISDATADAVAAQGIDRDRIVVTPLAPVPLPDGSPSSIVTAPYVLSVGEQMPRKGLPTLLRAFANANLDGVRLVHAGPESTQSAELRRLSEELGVRDRVEFRGHVSEHELATLYRHALLLCFPSQAEGFGIPMLEAMSVATPVVASDIPVLREVAGDAAEFVPPGNADAWRDALERLVPDDVARSELSRSGLIRARSFTWDRCAAATAVAYQRAMQ